jgi:hypothetical protein
VVHYKLKTGADWPARLGDFSSTLPRPGIPTSCVFLIPSSRGEEYTEQYLKPTAIKRKPPSFRGIGIIVRLEFPGEVSGCLTHECKFTENWGIGLTSNKPSCSPTGACLSFGPVSLGIRSEEFSPLYYPSFQINFIRRGARSVPATDLSTLRDWRAGSRPQIWAYHRISNRRSRNRVSKHLSLDNLIFRTRAAAMEVYKMDSCKPPILHSINFEHPATQQINRNVGQFLPNKRLRLRRCTPPRYRRQNRESARRW